jgi:D-arabinose 1-dehydrogenase-like Zn-dependent alcohol dehydrogenase
VPELAAPWPSPASTCPTSRCSITRSILSRNGSCAASLRTPGHDAREFLGIAAEHHLAVTVHPYPLDAADQALRDLKAGRFDGAAVLIP